MKNAYSRIWFETFLETQAYTEQEVAFICRHLPDPPYHRILDLCCGQGRHTRLLVAKGYEMTGVDSSYEALAKARLYTTAGQAVYIQQDMRCLGCLPGQFDAILCLWQSFGYFDDATNRDVVRQIRNKLGAKGRFILDIYQRAFFARHQGSRRIEREGIEILTTNRMTGNRLTAHLEYGDSNAEDTFEWQLYTPAGICAVVADFGFRCVLICTEYNAQKPLTADKPRMQLVFELD